MPSRVKSMAMVPLRPADEHQAFGLLVLGSPDPTRYAAQMGTEFLSRIGEVASACLARLLAKRVRPQCGAAAAELSPALSPLPRAPARASAGWRRAA